jgi:RNA polymerase sigma factor (sigma-70 family)
MSWRNAPPIPINPAESLAMRDAMEGEISRSSLWNSITPELRKLLQKPFKRDDPAAIPLWKHYLATRSRAAAERLYELYLPFVRVGVFKLFMSRRWLFPDGIGSMVSDGFLALRRVISDTESFDPDRFRQVLFTAIRKRIWAGRDRTEFGGARRAGPRRVLVAIRSELAHRLGRLPEREELLRELRGQIKHPNVHIACIDERPVEMRPFSELESPSIDRPMEFADPAADDPAKRAIESDLMRRTLNVLAPRDRQILRMVLRGKSGAEIARRFGISRERIRQRLNGILWEARNRADLATYFRDDSKALRSLSQRGKNDALPSAHRLLSA